MTILEDIPIWKTEANSSTLIFVDEIGTYDVDVTISDSAGRVVFSQHYPNRMKILTHPE